GVFSGVIPVLRLMRLKLVFLGILCADDGEIESATQSQMSFPGQEADPACPSHQEARHKPWHGLGLGFESAIKFERPDAKVDRPAFQHLLHPILDEAFLLPLHRPITNVNNLRKSGSPGCLGNWQKN
ncbi:MAG: hypothetical protein LBL95_05260, partial [Deltaproteobacteria bacterium]|nr:hypothetical protein [Deltaproteobacteria bacterium]